MCLLIQETKHHYVFSGAAVMSFAPWYGVIGSILVRHPKGTLLIDPSFGTQLSEDLQKAPWYSKAIMGDASTKISTVRALSETQIQKQEITSMAISHTHWDHVGGVRDFAAVPVLMSRAELEWSRAQTGAFAGGTMPHMLATDWSRVQAFDFDGPPMLGFAASHDLFGDGSVIALPLTGHTPGSTGYLINAPGFRALYVGDAAWQHRGVDQPVMKNPLLPIDADLPATADTLGRLHAAQRDNADLVVLTAHDLVDWYRVPMCREWASERN